MPGEDRLGGHESGEIQQRPSADSLPGNRQPTPLIIGQPNPSLAHLFERDAVLLA